MDRVRLGRVLGRGARMAARTVYDAVDAATAPAVPETNPQKPAILRPTAISPARNQVTPRAGNALRTVQQASAAATRVHRSVRTARQSAFAPVKRASRALTLEMTGSFFALFAISFCVAVWRTRGAWHHAGLNHGAAGGRLWLYVALALLFGYFSITSFARARRIQRG